MMTDPFLLNFEFGEYDSGQPRGPVNDVAEINCCGRSNYPGC